MYFNCRDIVRRSFLVRLPCCQDLRADEVLRIERTLPDFLEPRQLVVVLLPEVVRVELSGFDRWKFDPLAVVRQIIVQRFRVGPRLDRCILEASIVAKLDADLAWVER